MQVENLITLDFCRQRYLDVDVKQYDVESRLLKISCSYEGSVVELDDSYDYKFYAKVPSGKNYEFDDIITVEDNMLCFNIPKSVMYEVGKVICEVEAAKGEEELHSMCFYIHVARATVTDEDVLLEDEGHIIVRLVTELTALRDEAEIFKDQAGEYKDEAADEAAASAASAKESQSYSIGGTASRTGEDTDNSKYYSEQSNTMAKSAYNSATVATKSATSSAESANSSAESAENSKASASKTIEYLTETKAISDDLAGRLSIQGTIEFAELASKTATSGIAYVISDAFVTDDTFVTPGESYDAGTTVYCTSSGKWDIFPGASISSILNEFIDELFA